MNIGPSLADELVACNYKGVRMESSAMYLNYAEESTADSGVIGWNYHVWI